MPTRTKGADLDNAVAADLLGKHVPVGKCKPRQLWHVAMTKSGLASSWASIKDAQPLLSDFLDATGGRIPRQHSLTLQVDAFLKHNNMFWSLTDVELAVKCVRCMMQSVLAKKRNNCAFPRSIYVCNASRTK